MAQIKGRLTKDATLKQFDSGKEVVNFTIAVNDSYTKKDGEKVELVEFINCGYWFDSSMADALKKGMLVEAAGRIYASAYMKGDDPKGQINMEVYAVKFPFVPKKKEAQQEELPLEQLQEKRSGNRKIKPNKANAKAQAGAATLAEGGDDLPF